jgi:hypothetical protein
MNIKTAKKSNSTVVAIWGEPAVLAEAIVSAVEAGPKARNENPGGGAENMNSCRFFGRRAAIKFRAISSANQCPRAVLTMDVKRSPAICGQPI